MSGEPYCGNCGYKLQGLTNSAQCPECGKPLVEVLMREGFRFRQGRRYTSPIVIFGLPLLQIALGPHGDEFYGKARGIIAIGDVATGWFAFGGRAIGLVAAGGLAIGLVSIGGGAMGLLVALGGGAIGGIAIGGGAIGGIAVGGGAVGYVADGGGVYGVYARGGGAGGLHVISAMTRDPEAVRFFQDNSWLLGGGAIPMVGNVALLGWALIISMVFSLFLAAIVFVAQWRKRRAAGQSNPHDW